MIVNLEDVRAAWLAERPVFERVVKMVRDDIENQLMARGILALVSGRAKDVYSLVKKCMRTPYDEITDKAGVRVTTVFRSETLVAAQIIQASYPVIGFKDIRAGKGKDKLGYSGIHIDVEVDVNGTTRRCEIQLRTYSEHAWAEVSHGLAYKGPCDVEDRVVRDLNIISALVEVADMEFDRLREEVDAMPGAHPRKILRLLEPLYYKLVGVRYDSELSLEVIELLAPLLGDDPAQLLNEFLSDRGSALERVFQQRSQSPSLKDLLMLQPEAILVFMLLERDKYTLTELWRDAYPMELLEGMADAWAVELPRV